MIKKRKFDEIMDSLEHRNGSPKISEFTRKDCLFLYEKLADNSIEADHVFLSYEKQNNIIKSITQILVNLKKAIGYSPKRAEAIFG
ncbi:hypothetical protein ABN764_20055 [Paenibacillaceae sp. P-4]|uniref:hypothetical protein n=1 Tax=Paenibacillaceae bacterium P-4 TaxID=3160969 RepID=UPI0032E8152D